MPVSLFPHNQTAYDAVKEMLALKGKAAVIHPTGTGKSFIGFKLCEDVKDKTVCWLSPSEYIFKTQLENLSETSDGFKPENIKFFTYARLVFMTDEEFDEIRPDYIVLDEFHRCGSEVWGSSVMKLLAKYPEAKILGLSATNIRYLDDHRDMADEIFDGNIASMLTLGEAIVRNILYPPKYVLSIYSYQEELEKFEVRVKSARNKASKEEAEKYLEALRRTLEKADGIDDIFDRNMEDRTGKYIVFCANYEHMQDVISLNIRDWLKKVDTEPKIYTFYSGDTESSDSFDAFKADNDDTHIRLLFCIDALNEGVHVDDISGVILLRPTVSPIVYKQQIGRALSASKSKKPVIFDIVNNIENLYSIDSIREEMQTAVQYFRNNGEGGTVVNERFELIDKLAECRELFSRLEGSLSEGWDLMWEKAREYYLEHGDLEVPKKSDKYGSLGSWITTQRRVYSGKSKGVLTQAQIMKLDSIGMRWGSKDEANWERYIKACRKYREEHGNLLVPADHKEGNVNLGAFISNMRTRFKNKDHPENNDLAERIAVLNELGMVWDVSEYLFNENYRCALRYFKEHGALNCPSTYIEEESGIALGSWCSNIRNNKELLSDEQIKMLNDINFSWNNHQTDKWHKNFNEVKKYYEANGNINIPVSYFSDEVCIGKWIRSQREKFRKGNLSEEQIRMLDGLGMVWDIPDPWEKKFMLLENYYKEHGNIKLPYDLVVEGVWLSKWLNTQINAGEGKTKKPLTDEQKRKLESVGVKFDGKRHIDEIWNERIEQCRRFYEKNGHLNVPKETYPVLARWLTNQKNRYHCGKLTAYQTESLEMAGMKWGSRRTVRTSSESMQGTAVSANL